MKNLHRHAPRSAPWGRLPGWRGRVAVAGFLMLALAWLPTWFAAAMAVGNLHGEHELRCVAAPTGFEVVLHHSTAVRHHHTWLEQAMLGDAAEHEKDHHLGFRAIDRVHDVSEDSTPDDAGELLGLTALPSPDFTWIKTLRSPHEVPHRGPPPLWRGVVMTI